MVSPLKTNIDEYTNSVGRYPTGGINGLFITIDFMRPRWGILLHTMKTYCTYIYVYLEYACVQPVITKSILKCTFPKKFKFKLPLDTI